MNIICTGAYPCMQDSIEAKLWTLYIIVSIGTACDWVRQCKMTCSIYSNEMALIERIDPNTMKWVWEVWSF